MLNHIKFTKNPLQYNHQNMCNIKCFFKKHKIAYKFEIFRPIHQRPVSAVCISEDY